MQKRLRDLLRAVVTDLRHTLTGERGTANGGAGGQRGDLDRELERLGIEPDGTVTPFDALPNPTAADRKARRAAEAQLSAAPVGNKATVRSEIVERAAYTWINRLLALRAMEARALINPVLRADPAYDGLSEALFVLRQTNPQAASGPDAGWWTVIEDACREQAASLPGLFDLADPSASLRPSTPALLRCVALMGNPPAGYTADEADVAFADPDAIGWAYQFYQEEAKARTYAKLNAGGKAATRAEIASVTQLFTEPYMVKWLLQNSLGRTYHQLYPDSRLPGTWEYYIRDLPKDDGAGGDDRRPPVDDLDGLTFMDPCMGSGHFEREAFDMLAAMYREQQPGMGAAEIADRVLTRHLHGIDLDPRAAQLAALTLYLRAWELVAEERRSRRLPGPGTYRPPAMNLATTPTGLTPGSLERHLQRHPEDRVYRPLLEGIFAALEQADVLGSLLRPGEQLDAAIRAFRARGDGQMQLVSEDADLNRLLAELAQHDPGELKRVLLERVARSFAADAGEADDVTAALFGREIGEGLRLLQLLDRKYVAVATNPPYMGFRNMSAPIQTFCEKHFEPGKADLYAVFMLRSLDFCMRSGRVAMVTQQSWMFLRSFANLRAVTTKEQRSKRVRFGGVLTETTIEAVAHLGPNAFEEIGGEVVQTAMFVIRVCQPQPSNSLMAVRLTALESSQIKASRLREANALPDGRLRFSTRQASLVELPESPIAYWLRPRMIELLRDHGTATTTDYARVSQGLTTGNMPRFVRFCWEVRDRRWTWYTSGGGYARWAGFESSVVDWEKSGCRVSRYVSEHYPPEKFTLLIKQPETFGIEAVYYATMAGGSLGPRLSTGAVFGDSAPAVFHSRINSYALAALLSTRLFSFLVRALSSSTLSIRDAYITRLPLYNRPISSERLESLARIARWAERAKLAIVSDSPVERKFVGETVAYVSSSLEQKAALLSVAEAVIENSVFDAYRLGRPDIDSVLQETGTPIGWNPLIAGYDATPPLSEDLDSPLLPSELIDAISEHPRVAVGPAELVRTKELLEELYRAGMQGKDRTGFAAQEDDPAREDEARTVSEAQIPIPSETFLEQLSATLQIHPISVYWLLEELRAEGIRCKPEELRLLEDRLSVLVLRLLGHRWPRQIEAGEPVPPWADPDGIIPLTPIAGETSLAERLRDRLRDEDGDRGAQQVEALLLELTGLTLEEWLRRTFFSRHARQFKHRPIAWHMASTPSKDGPRRGKVKREPAFQCLLYYHACRGDVLARLRAHYVEPLIRLETAAAADARRRGDETATAIAVSRVHELEEFADRLRAIAEEGFACGDLEHLLEGEPLDRWSGDGIVAPASAEELAAQERSWHVDINDGVRVNIAPLQLAGLLASEVLRPDDARKAIADRARWRSDERRWVREGVLPRCGWMDGDVPESPRWTERAPEREAETRRLEEKRRAVMEKLSSSEVLAPGKMHE